MTGPRLLVAAVALAAVGALAWLGAQVLLGDDEEIKNQLAAFRREVLAATHVEPKLEYEAPFLTQPGDSRRHVTILFSALPPGVDKAELEKSARELAKQKLKGFGSVDVRFGDNLRTRPLEKDDGRAAPFGLPQPSQGPVGLPKKQ